MSKYVKVPYLSCQDSIPFSTILLNGWSPISMPIHLLKNILVASKVLPVMDKSACMSRSSLIVCRYKHLTHLDPWMPRSRTGSYDKIMKESEDYFQRTINTLCSSGGETEALSLLKQWWEVIWAQSNQHSLPQSAEEDSPFSVLWDLQCITWRDRRDHTGTAPAGMSPRWL